jgi:hypothetical protein
MVPVMDLWLPIVLSAVFVFVVSSLIHMVLQVHKNDYAKLSAEDRVLAELRAHAIPPGTYAFPACTSMKEMRTPEMIAKREQGPVGFMTILPSGQKGMGKNLLQWFVLSLVIGLFAGYVGGLALGPGARAMDVLQVTSTVAFVGYALSNATDSIWKGVPWSVTVKFILDGLLYALATGAAFALLWPGA